MPDDYDVRVPFPNGLARTSFAKTTSVSFLTPRYAVCVLLVAANRRREGPFPHERKRPNTASRSADEECSLPCEFIIPFSWFMREPFINCCARGCKTAPPRPPSGCWWGIAGVLLERPINCSERLLPIRRNGDVVAAEVVDEFQ